MTNEETENDRDDFISAVGSIMDGLALVRNQALDADAPGEVEEVMRMKASLIRILESYLARHSAETEADK